MRRVLPTHALKCNRCFSAEINGMQHRPAHSTSHTHLHVAARHASQRFLYDNKTTVKRERVQCNIQKPIHSQRGLFSRTIVFFELFAFELCTHARFVFISKKYNSIHSTASDSVQQPISIATLAMALPCI